MNLMQGFFLYYFFCFYLLAMIPVFLERGNALSKVYNLALSNSSTSYADVDIQSTLSTLVSI
jgi:hypothetical protein